MKHLILLCNIENTSFEDLKTSSSRYELQFANCMKDVFDKISIISPRLLSNSSSDNIDFVKTEDGNLINAVESIIRKTETLLNNTDSFVILFWGYNPILIYKLSSLKSHNIKVVSMIYDTHIGSIENKIWYKKYVVDIFYRIGMRFINKLDGVILFKKTAKEVFKIKIPYMITLPIADKIQMSEDVQSDDKHQIEFLYGGTLISYNGIVELIDGFEKVENDTAKLVIYGNGPLASYVSQKCKDNKKIVYKGLVTNQELAKAMKSADVLISLRKIPSMINDVAFPSKIVEYMSLGKVVMSTNVSEYKEFSEAVFLVNDMTSQEIAKTMQYICDHRNEFQDKINISYQYLNKYHSSKKLQNDMNDFISKLFD